MPETSSPRKNLSMDAPSPPGSAMAAGQESGEGRGWLESKIHLGSSRTLCGCGPCGVRSAPFCLPPAAAPPLRSPLPPPPAPDVSEDCHGRPRDSPGCGPGGRRRRHGHCGTQTGLAFSRALWRTAGPCSSALASLARPALHKAHAGAACAAAAAAAAVLARMPALVFWKAETLLSLSSLSSLSRVSRCSPLTPSPHSSRLFFPRVAPAAAALRSRWPGSPCSAPLVRNRAGRQKEKERAARLALAPRSSPAACSACPGTRVGVGGRTGGAEPRACSCSCGCAGNLQCLAACLSISSFSPRAASCYCLLSALQHGVAQPAFLPGPAAPQTISALTRRPPPSAWTMCLALPPTCSACARYAGPARASSHRPVLAVRLLTPPSPVLALWPPVDSNALVDRRLEPVALQAAPRCCRPRH